MVKNLILTTIRHLIKHKTFFFINLVGFSLGLACVLLIAGFIINEIRYDNYHPEAESIYRVALKRHFPDRENSYATTPAPLGPTVFEEFPEVRNYCRIFQPGEQQRIVLGDRIFYENSFYAADSTFFDLFGVRVLEGNPKTALNSPNQVVITESTNKRYFGNTSGLNQIIEIGDTTRFMVSAICEDVPKRSHFQFDMLMSLTSLPIARSDFWASYAVYNYIKLESPEQAQKVYEKLPELIDRHIGPQVESILGVTYQQYVDAGNIHDYYLQPIQSIHLDSHLQGELRPNGDKVYVWLFSCVALLVLAIAAFNFTNLAIAQSTKRSKEIGVRKVLGAAKNHLFAQFIVESVIIATIAVLVALGLAWWSLPYFNQLTGRNMVLQDFSIGGTLAFLLALIAIIGFAAGAYPALFMASTKITSIFKGGVRLSHSRFGLRNGLIVFQFAISIFLVLATAFIMHQVNFMMNQKLGFDQDRVMVIETGSNLGSRYLTLVETLENDPAINSLSASFHLPGRQPFGGTFQAIGNPETERFLFSLYLADFNFLETFNIPMVAGRAFMEDMALDSIGVIINETCARMVGWSPEEAIGKQILVTGQPHTEKIIGVIKDFHLTSLHEPIRSLVMRGISRQNLNQTQPAFLALKLNHATNLQQTIEAIEQKWQLANPQETFRYSFLDNDFEALYESEKQFASLFRTFSILAIIISIIGVIGLALYIAVEKRKEIGIRKVLGASVPQIISLLSKEFLILLAVANLLVWPIAYLLTNAWLNNFAFSSQPPLIIFGITGLAFATLIIGVVSSVSYRAANANPVEAISRE